MAWYSFNKKTTADTNITGANGGSNYRSFSTPFGEVGDANLSLPYVSRYYTQQGYVRFGSDNLYPQLLNQLYFTSPIHGACIDFITNATIGSYYKFDIEAVTGIDKVNQLTFERTNKFKKLSKILTRDFVIHRRVCVLVIRREDGSFKCFRRLDPATIRNSHNNMVFSYSSDYSRGIIENTYNRYSVGSKDLESLYVYQEEAPGQDNYAIPRYNSILNWAFLDGEQSFLQKSNIKNSIWPSMIIRNPKQFGSQDEVDVFKHGISSNKGAGKSGNVVVLSGNGMEEVPEIVIPSPNANDKLFETTSKDIKENICISHMINPSIMGVKTQGQLGATTELQDSYKIFEKNVVIPLREEMEEILNDLLDCTNIKNSITINDYKIIDPLA